MINTHVSEGEETRGRYVPCRANTKPCPKGGGYAHVEFAGLEELNAYNAMTHELSDINSANEVAGMFLGEVEPSEKAKVRSILEPARNLHNDRIRLKDGESMDKETLRRDLAEGRVAQENLWETTSGLSTSQPVGITNLRQGPVTTSGGWVHKMDTYRKGIDGRLKSSPDRSIFCNGSTMVSIKNGKEMVPEYDQVHARTGSLVTLSTRRHPDSSVTTVENCGDQGLDLHDNTRGQALDDLIDAMERDTHGEHYNFQVSIRPYGKVMINSDTFDGGNEDRMLPFDIFRNEYPSAAKHLDTLIAGDAGYGK